MRIDKREDRVRRWDENAPYEPNLYKKVTLCSSFPKAGGIENPPTYYETYSIPLPIMSRVLKTARRKSAVFLGCDCNPRSQSAFFNYTATAQFLLSSILEMNKTVKPQRVHYLTGAFGRINYK